MATPLRHELPITPPPHTARAMFCSPMGQPAHPKRHASWFALAERPAHRQAVSTLPPETCPRRHTRRSADRSCVTIAKTRLRAMGGHRRPSVHTTGATSSTARGPSTHGSPHTPAAPRRNRGSCALGHPDRRDSRRARQMRWNGRVDCRRTGTVERTAHGSRAELSVGRPQPGWPRRRRVGCGDVPSGPARERALGGSALSTRHGDAPCGWWAKSWRWRGGFT